MCIIFQTILANKISVFFYREGYNFILNFLLNIIPIIRRLREQLFDQSLMYRVVARRLFHRIDRIVLGEHCYSLLTLFIVYHPRTSLGTKTGEYIYRRIDFPIQTSGSYFSSSRANTTGAARRRFARAIDAARVVFTAAKLEHLPIARD